MKRGRLPGGAALGSRMVVGLAMAMLLTGAAVAAGAAAPAAASRFAELPAAARAEIDRLEREAEAARAAGRYADLEAAFRGQLAICLQTVGENHPATADAWYRLGFALGMMGRLAEAEAADRKALDLRIQLLGEDHADTAASYNNVAMRLDAQARYSEAMPLHARALDIRRRLLGEDSKDTATSYHNLGGNLLEQARPAEALPLLQKALDIRRRVLGEEARETLVTLGTIAAVYESEGRYREAEPMRRDALEAVRRSRGDDHADAIGPYSGLADNLDGQGRYTEAATLHERSLAIRRRVFGDGHAATAVGYSEVAGNLAAQGRYAEAGPLYATALDINRQALGERHPGTATAYGNLAVNLLRQRRAAEAEALFRKALDIDLQVLGADHPGVAKDYLNVAEAITSAGRFAEATPAFERALEILRTKLGDDHPDTATAYEALAGNRADTGQPALAIPLYEQAARIVIKVFGEVHPHTARLYDNVAASMADRALQLGDTALESSAVELTQAALAIRVKLYGAGSPMLTTTYRNLAVSQLRLPGQAGAALGNARAMAAILRRGRQQAQDLGIGDTARLRESRATAPDFTLVADAAWQRAAEAPAERPALRSEAFAALQDAVASSAGAAVAQMGARFSSGDDTLRRLARERQDLETRRGDVDTELLQALAAIGPDASTRAAELRAEAAKLQAALDDLDIRLRERFPAYFELISPDALDVATAQRLLHEGEALLLVVPDGYGTQVFAVTPTGADWHRSPWQDTDVASAAARLRCDLDAGRCLHSGSQDGAPERGAARVPQAQGKKARRPGAFDLATAHALYEQLVAPVESTIGDARTLYVVTTGALSSLPFSVLVTAAPQAGADEADPQVLQRAPWLLRRYALATLPSVASLKALRTFQRGSGTPPAGVKTTDAQPLEFLGFGDPVLGAGSGTGPGPVRAAALFKGIAGNGAGLADPAALRAAFNPLPGTRIELEAMSAAFAPLAAIRLGVAATEPAVRRQDYRGIRVVAFATHGLVAGEIDGIAEPGLVLTPPAAASADDDGLLSATEVAQLRLEADWVILSACNTAASDGTPGADALSGLARAFFYAGARALLVSHWPVRDDVASVLTVDAIRRQRDSPALGRAGALRQATLAILDSSAADQPAFAHPSAWAPFSLVGEAR